MAITQARMLSLINAARDYQRAFKHAREVLADEFRRDPNNDLLRSLRDTISESNLLQDPVGSTMAIEREAYHFRLRAQYNDRQRAKQAQRRHRIAENLGLLDPRVNLHANSPFIRQSTAPTVPPGAVERPLSLAPSTLPSPTHHRLDPSLADDLDLHLGAPSNPVFDPDTEVDLNPIEDVGQVDADMIRTDLERQARARQAAAAAAIPTPTATDPDGTVADPFAPTKSPPSPQK